jgi:hypothetical protein
MTSEIWFGVLGTAAGVLSAAISYLASRSAKRSRAACHEDFGVEARQIIAEYHKTITGKRVPSKASVVRRSSAQV